MRTVGLDAGTKNGVEVRFDIILPRHFYLKHREQLKKSTATPLPPANAVNLHRNAIAEALLADADEKLRDSFVRALAAASSLPDLLNAFDAPNRN